MYSVKDRDSVLAEFESVVSENVANNCSDMDMLSYMEQGNADLVRECVLKVQNNIIAAIPEGISVPKVSLYVSSTGSAEGISLVTITVTNKISATKKFKYASQVSRNNPVKKLVDFLTMVYSELIVDVMADENLAVVNGVISEIVEKAGVDYTVSVVSGLGRNGRKVDYISDDEVVFVANDDRVFMLNDILAVAEPSEVLSEEAIEDAIAKEAENIMSAQTVEQLVEKHGGYIISYLADINSQVRHMTLIKKVCSKNVSSLRGNKDSMAYFSEGDVYAIVARRDGQFEVVLSPFNIKTLRKEQDFDLLSKLA